MKSDGIKRIARVLQVILIPAMIYIVFLVLAPRRFGNIDSAIVIVTQTIVPSILALGMCFGMGAGLFDLSMGSEIVLSSIIGGLCAMRFGLPGLIVGCVASGMILGAITGGLYTALRIPSFVISLGMVLIYEVAGSSLSGSQNFISLGSSLTILGSPLWTVAIGALVFGIFTLIFYRTEFAYHVRAVGGDELVAKNMGVKVGLTKALTYVVGGFFIGVVSILNVSYAGTVAAQLAMSSFSMVFMPMMGMIIGMQLLNVCSLPLGIFIGELSINMIFLGFMAVGLPSTLQNSVLGAFLLIVIGFSENKRKLQRLFGGSKTVAVAATH